MRDRRGGSELIALVVGAALVAVASTGAASLLRLQGAVSFALGAGVLAFAEVVVVSHVLSLFDAYECGWLLAALALLASVVAVAWLAIRPPVPDIGRAAVIRHVLDDRLVLALGLVVLAESVYLFALAVFTPPTEYDVLTYHLTRATLWIQNESVRPVAGVTDLRINEFPPNAEILTAATMLLSQSVRWAALVQGAALVATVAAIYGIAGRIGFDRRQAAFGALLFPTLPVVALQAPTALNDLVVAALVATAVFFTLGRGGVDLGLACAATALLAGTKVTVALAIPVLIAVVLLTHRGGRLFAALACGAASLAVGATWYVAHRSAGGGVLGSHSNEAGFGDGLLAMSARATRYAVETVEVPGATGRDEYVYLGAAALVVVCGIAAGRRRVALLGAGLTAVPLLLLSIEHGLERVYYNGWQLTGYDAATGLGITRDPTVASNLQSWYGPVGLVMTVAAVVVVTRSAARGSLPWVAVVCAVAPVAFLCGAAIATGYNPFTGRFVMGGVALGAATWGIVRSWPPAAVATVAVAAATVFLSLVHYTEKPSGLRLLEATHRASIWSLPREWAQSIQPEVARLIGYVDHHAPSGTTVAIAPEHAVYPFAYVGWPNIEHRIVYANTLADAAREGAQWAVLSDRSGCVEGWRRSFHSAPWAVWRRSSDVHCP